MGSSFPVTWVATLEKLEAWQIISPIKPRFIVDKVIMGISHGLIQAGFVNIVLNSKLPDQHFLVIRQKTGCFELSLNEELLQNLNFCWAH